MSKAEILNPNSNQSLGVYDQTKFSLMGRAVNNVISAKNVVGPNRGLWLDTATDFAAVVTPGYTQTTPNGRHFVLQTPAAGVGVIAMYTISNLNASGTPRTRTIVGRIQFAIANTAATTHTVRGFTVDDSNASNIKIAVFTTGSVLINGGIFYIPNLTNAEFVSVPTTIQFATGSNQKRVYFLQDPAAVGVNNNQTVGNGCDFDTSNGRLYFHHGAFNAAVAAYYDTTVSADCPGQTFTITIAAPGVVTAAGHGYNNNDQVALYTTGALPTGLTASVDGGAQTVYFVRNATANTFELSATTGGASITTTGAQSGTHTVRRAFGITTAVTLVKTGTILTLNTGTAYVRTNSFTIGTPTNPPITSNNPNAGNKCFFYSTDTRLSHFRVSDITGGATILGTLQEVNTIGAIGDTLQTLTPSFVKWSDTIQGFCYYVNDRIFVKRFDPSVVLAKYGCRSNQYLTGLTDPTPKLGLATVNSMDMALGWVFISSSVAGQIGVVGYDLSSDYTWDSTRLISPVQTITRETAQWIAAAADLPKTEGGFEFFYRTQDFSSATLSWISAGGDGKLPDVDGDINNQIQYMIEYKLDNSYNQVERMFEITQPKNENSSNWVGSVDNTTANSLSPARTAFRLVNAYASSVPTLYFRAYDDSGNLVASADTASNPGMFEYSTNNGTSWLSLGTIPNTINTTEVRYNWTSPPGVNVTASIRES